MDRPHRRLLVTGVRRPGRFTADRKHASHGPFTAYIPIIGILLFSHYEEYVRNLARGAVVVCVAALLIVAAQLLAHWLLGNLPAATFHPGTSCRPWLALSSPASG